MPCRRRSLLAGLLVAAAAGLVAPAAEAVVLGFDELGPGTLIDEAYAAQGGHFGQSPFPGTTGPFTAQARPQARSAPNVAAFSHDPGTDFSSSWIKFDRQQRKVTFHVCRTGGAGDPPRPNVNVLVYDSNGTAIENRQGIECDLNGPPVPITI